MRNRRSASHDYDQNTKPFNPSCIQVDRSALDHSPDIMTVLGSCFGIFKRKISGSSSQMYYNVLLNTPTTVMFPSIV